MEVINLGKDYIAVRLMKKMIIPFVAIAGGLVMYVFLKSSIWRMAGMLVAVAGLVLDVLTLATFWKKIDCPRCHNALARKSLKENFVCQFCNLALNLK